MKRTLSGLALALAALSPFLASAAGADAALVKRGEYLARAADCMACHTAEGGAPFAGGLPIQSPFGTIYGTNITPDKEHGIGAYSTDEFFAALTEGKRKDGAYLYPAMPYTSYHLIEREDADAIYAYLMAQEPIARPAPQTSLSFPFNVRMGLAGWNLLYGKSVRLQPEEGRSEAWKRGQYMVEVLGHCGECHTPRNLAGALEQDKRLSGGLLNGYLAPSLLPGDLAARGWTQPDLASFLKHGMSAQGSMFNEMFPVVHHSTQHLDDSDLAAMATYLLGDQPPPAKLPITLLLALPRPKMLRRVLQTIAAMGVPKLVLLNSYRVEKSFWQTPFLDPAAIRENLVLGLEQARDTVLPEIIVEKRFKPFVEDRLPALAAGSLGLVGHPGPWPACPRAVEKPVTLAIGPEGGWIPYEVDKLREAGLHPVQLGERILRVETAVSALLARLF